MNLISVRTKAANKLRWWGAWWADLWVLIKDVVRLFHYHVIKEATDQAGLFIIATLAFATLGALTDNGVWLAFAAFTAFRWGQLDAIVNECDRCHEPLIKVVEEDTPEK